MIGGILVPFWPEITDRTGEPARPFDKLRVRGKLIQFPHFGQVWSHSELVEALRRSAGAVSNFFYDLNILGVFTRKPCIHH